MMPEPSSDERKAFLKELNRLAQETAEVLHGEDVAMNRVRQYKKYFNKTYKMLHRLTALKGDINNNSFKYGYGGKLLSRRVLLELGVIKKAATGSRKATYHLCVPTEALSLELVSRIIVEVYLIRNDVQPL